MRADIAPGATFPDYELTDQTKTRRSLSELQGDDPLILVLAMSPAVFVARKVSIVASNGAVFVAERMTRLVLA